MAFQPSNPQCPQCGMFHPPIQEGEECPLKSKNSDSPDNPNFIPRSQIDITKFMGSIKTILLNNIEKKEIQDIEKFQNHLIVELNKIIEEYKE